MPTRHVDLTDHHDQFVDSLVASGRFESPSEVMRAGLRLLEAQAREEEQKLALLRSLASEGFHELDQGQGTPIGDRQELAEFIAEIGIRAADRVKAHSAGE